jgi:hypothetical protein
MLRRIWTQIAPFMLKPSRQKNHLLKWRWEWMNEYQYEGTWQQDLKNLKSKPCTEVWNDQNLVPLRNSQWVIYEWWRMWSLELGLQSSCYSFKGGEGRGEIQIVFITHKYEHHVIPRLNNHDNNARMVHTCVWSVYQNKYTSKIRATRNLCAIPAGWSYIYQCGWSPKVETFPT